MRIDINDQFCFSAFQPSDEEACLEHFRAREIYENTLRLPFPYTEADFNNWMGIVEKTTKEQGQPVNWAIRNSGLLIGGLGFDDLTIGKSHRAEIGYWLARPYWGQGIMTAAIQRARQFVFGEWGLSKIMAHVFARNVASARVLEKCGFEQEGYLKRHHLKDGQLLDAKLYGLVREAT